MGSKEITVKLSCKFYKGVNQATLYKDLEKNYHKNISIIPFNIIFGSEKKEDKTQIYFLEKVGVNQELDEPKLEDLYQYVGTLTRTATTQEVQLTDTISEQKYSGQFHYSDKNETYIECVEQQTQRTGSRLKNVIVFHSLSRIAISPFQADQNEQSFQNTEALPQKPEIKESGFQIQENKQTENLTPQQVKEKFEHLVQKKLNFDNKGNTALKEILHKEGQSDHYANVCKQFKNNPEIDFIIKERYNRYVSVGEIIRKVAPLQVPHIRIVNERVEGLYYDKESNHVYAVRGGYGSETLIFDVYCVQTGEQDLETCGFGFRVNLTISDSVDVRDSNIKANKTNKKGKDGDQQAILFTGSLRVGFTDLKANAFALTQLENGEKLFQHQEVSYDVEKYNQVNQDLVAILNQLETVKNQSESQSELFSEKFYTEYIDEGKEDTVPMVLEKNLFYFTTLELRDKESKWEELSPQLLKKFDKQRENSIGGDPKLFHLNENPFQFEELSSQLDFEAFRRVYSKDQINAVFNKQKITHKGAEQPYFDILVSYSAFLLKNFLLEYFSKDHQYDTTIELNQINSIDLSSRERVRVACYVNDSRRAEEDKYLGPLESVQQEQAQNKQRSSVGPDQGSNLNKRPSVTKDVNDPKEKPKLPIDQVKFNIQDFVFNLLHQVSTFPCEQLEEESGANQHVQYFFFYALRIVERSLAHGYWGNASETVLDQLQSGVEAAFAKVQTLDIVDNIREKQNQLYILLTNVSFLTLVEIFDRFDKGAMFFNKNSQMRLQKVQDIIFQASKFLRDSNELMFIIQFFQSNNFDPIMISNRLMNPETKQQIRQYKQYKISSGDTAANPSSDGQSKATTEIFTKESEEQVFQLRSSFIQMLTNNQKKFNNINSQTFYEDEKQNLNLFCIKFKELTQTLERLAANPQTQQLIVTYNVHVLFLRCMKMANQLDYKQLDSSGELPDIESTILPLINKIYDQNFAAQISFASQKVYNQVFIQKMPPLNDKSTESQIFKYHSQQIYQFVILNSAFKSDMRLFHMNPFLRLKVHEIFELFINVILQYNKKLEQQLGLFDKINIFTIQKKQDTLDNAKTQILALNITMLTFFKRLFEGKNVPEDVRYQFGLQFSTSEVFDSYKNTFTRMISKDLKKILDDSKIYKNHQIQSIMAYAISQNVNQNQKSDLKPQYAIIEAYRFLELLITQTSGLCNAAFLESLRNTLNPVLFTPYIMEKYFSDDDNGKQKKQEREEQEKKNSISKPLFPFYDISRTNTQLYSCFWELATNLKLAGMTHSTNKNMVFYNQIQSHKDKSTEAKGKDKNPETKDKEISQEMRDLINMNWTISVEIYSEEFGKNLIQTIKNTTVLFKDREYFSVMENKQIEKFLLNGLCPLIFKYCANLQYNYSPNSRILKSFEKDDAKQKNMKVLIVQPEQQLFKSDQKSVLKPASQANQGDQQIQEQKNENQPQQAQNQIQEQVQKMFLLEILGQILEELKHLFTIFRAGKYQYIKQDNSPLEKFQKIFINTQNLHPSQFGLIVNNILVAIHKLYNTQLLVPDAKEVEGQELDDFSFHKKINRYIYNPEQLGTKLDLDSYQNETVQSKLESYKKTDFFEYKSKSRVNRYIEDPYQSIFPNVTKDLQTEEKEYYKAKKEYFSNKLSKSGLVTELSGPEAVKEDNRTSMVNLFLTKLSKNNSSLEDYAKDTNHTFLALQSDPFFYDLVNIFDDLVTKVEEFRTTITKQLYYQKDLASNSDSNEEFLDTQVGERFIKVLYFGMSTLWQDLVYHAVPNQIYFQRIIQFISFSNLLKNIAERNNMEFKRFIYDFYSESTDIKNAQINIPPKFLTQPPTSEFEGPNNFIQGLYYQFEEYTHGQTTLWKPESFTKVTLMDRHHQFVVFERMIEVLAELLVGSFKSGQQIIFNAHSRVGVTSNQNRPSTIDGMNKTIRRRIEPLTSSYYLILQQTINFLKAVCEGQEPATLEPIMNTKALHFFQLMTFLGKKAYYDGKNKGKIVKGKGKETGKDQTQEGGGLNQSALPKAGEQAQAEKLSKGRSAYDGYEKATNNNQSVQDNDNKVVNQVLGKHANKTLNIDTEKKGKYIQQALQCVTHPRVLDIEYNKPESGIKDSFSYEMALSILSLLKIYESFRQFGLNINYYIQRAKRLETQKQIYKIKKLKEVDDVKNILDNIKQEELFHIFLYLYEGQLIVEIQGEAGQTMTISFIKQSECFYVKEETLSHYYDQCSFQDPQKRMSDLLGFIDSIKATMIMNQILSQKAQWFYAITHDYLFRYYAYFCYLLTLSLNITILIGYERKTVGGELSFRSDELKLASEIQAIMLISFAFIFTVMLLFSKIFPIFIYKKEIMEKSKGSQPRLKNFVNQSDLINFVLHVILTVIGLVWVKFFFALNLLLLVNLSKDINYVVEAFRKNFGQMLAALWLAIIITNTFSFITAQVFPDRFSSDDVGDLLICSDTLECFLNVMNLGFRNGGGIGDTMNLFERGHKYFFIKAVYDLGFFILVNFVCMNIIFGIIVDAFAQMRDESILKKDFEDNQCFICGLGRQDFESAKVEFNTHRSSLHNKNNYIFFIIHIMQKSQEDMDGNEIYVHDLIQKNSAKWVPKNQSRDLNNAEEDSSLSQAKKLAYEVMEETKYLLEK